MIEEEVSDDLQLRIDRQKETAYSKVEMNRKIIHQVVRDRLLSIINKLIKGGIELSYLEDDYFKELVTAFVPFFEVCSLCKYDNKCHIQDTIKSGNISLYTLLQSNHPTIDISPTFTITKCGFWDFIDIKEIITQGWENSREKSLRGG